MDPIVPGTTVPNGTKIPGTPYQMDPVSVSPCTRLTRQPAADIRPVHSRGAFAIGTQIRWLDFNE